MFTIGSTPGGFGLYKILNPNLFSSPSSVIKIAKPSADPSELFELVSFKQFKTPQDGLKASIGISGGDIPKTLKSLLKKHIAKNEDLSKIKLAVADQKLSKSISDALGITCFHDSTALEISRAIKTHLESLTTGLDPTTFNSLARGLAFQYSRFKLQLSLDKVDSMIVRSIGILEDVEKQVNVFSMRVREWYSWHFPDLSRLIEDDDAYLRVIIRMGKCSNANNVDLEDILDEDDEAAVKKASILTVGSDITDADIEQIQKLCNTVLTLKASRLRLISFLEKRMDAIAPNLTHLVGARIGAKLIAHAGSLLSLAKHPASTLQLYGAEKALFRSLNSKQPTPKYGIIYHASLVGKAAPKFKGAVARILAAKCALSSRVDAFSENPSLSIAEVDIEKVKNSIERYHNRELYRSNKESKKSFQTQSYTPNRGQNSQSYKETDYMKLGDSPARSKRSRDDDNGSNYSQDRKRKFRS